MERMKTLVLGLGNTILTDDGVGIYVAREIKKLIDGDHSIDIKESSLAGLNLLDLLTGYDRVIIIDSIKTDESVGELYRLTPDELKSTKHMDSPHQINIATALELGKYLHLDLPMEIIIYAINVQCNDIFSENPTPEINRLIPEIAKRILDYERANLN